MMAQRRRRRRPCLTAQLPTAVVLPFSSPHVSRIGEKVGQGAVARDLLAVIAEADLAAAVALGTARQRCRWRRGA